MLVFYFFFFCCMANICKHLQQEQQQQLKIFKEYFLNSIVNLEIKREGKKKTKNFYDLEDYFPKDHAKWWRQWQF